MTDAHNHLWIEAVPEGAPGSPVLTGRDAILGELAEYRQAGGAAIVDCQPGGCGRNGTALAELSQGSGVTVIACTGFHRRDYYAPGWWLWEAGSGQAARYFVDEIQAGLQETLASGRPVQAGFIKVACEATVRDTPQSALRGRRPGCRRDGRLRRGPHRERRGCGSHPRLFHPQRGAPGPAGAVPHG